MALSSLAYAMHDSAQAAVVRRVYRANLAPRIGALIPEYRTDEDGNDEMVRDKYCSTSTVLYNQLCFPVSIDFYSQGLVYVELPYMEDVRDFEFAPVYNDEVRPGQEQLAAMDELIETMRLRSEAEG